MAQRLVVEEYPSYSHKDVTLRIDVFLHNFIVVFSTDSDTINDVDVISFNSLNGARRFIKQILSSEIEDFIPA